MYFQESSKRESGILKSSTQKKKKKKSTRRSALSLNTKCISKKRPNSCCCPTGHTNDAYDWPAPLMKAQRISLFPTVYAHPLH